MISLSLRRLASFAGAFALAFAHFPALPLHAAPGDPDLTFGTGGRVTTPFAGSAESAEAVAVLADGRTLVAGTTVRADGDFLLVRYTAAGALDPTFGSGGKVTTDFGVTADTAKAMGLQNDGKIVIAGTTTGVNGSDIALARYLPDGMLDVGFGTGGRVSTNLLGTDEGQAVAVQADGAILVVGRRFTGSRWEVAVVRYLPTGAVDASFGTGGVTIAGDLSASLSGNAVVVQPDGRIVVAGYTGAGSFLLLRFTAAGLLDSGFGAGGKATTAVSSSELTGNAVALQSDGKIVVAGSGTVAGPQLQIALARYSSAGALDATFGFGGTTFTGVGAHDASARGLLIQSDGRVLVTGAITPREVPAGYPSPPPGLILLRYSASGVADSGFSASSGVGSGEALALQADGKVVVAGTSTNTLDPDFAVFRFQTNAALDPAFGSGGSLLTDVGFDREDRARDVARQADGKIVVAGHIDRGSNWDWGLARFTSSGVLDTSFAGTGKRTTAIGPSFDFCESVAIQPDGKILAAGSTWNGSNYDFALARYFEDGQLDVQHVFNAGFGGDGIATTAIGTGDEQIFKVLVQSDGKVVAAGYTRSGSDFDLAVVRYLSHGELDSSFGAGGKVTTGVGSGDDFGSAAVLQSDGKVVVGGYSHNGSNFDFALVRYTTAGALDPTFGTGGKVVTPVGAGTDVAFTMALQSDGKILLAGYANNGTRDDIALVRYTTTGALDATFGSGGKVVTATGTTPTQASDVAVQSDGRIVAIGTAFGAPDDTVLQRYTSSGVLDSTFGIGGRAAPVFGSLPDRSNGVVIQPDGRIAVAGRAIVNGNWDYAVARYQAADATEAPTLSSPVASATMSRPFAVAFTRPEAALAGSVRLTFTGSVTRVLTLAASQQSAGVHAFSFDPANPTGSPEIVSGTAIPDGLYTVALSYQDAQGSAAASASAANVRLDTTPLAQRKLAELGNAGAPDLGDPDADALTTLAEYGLVLPMGVSSIGPVAQRHVYLDGAHLRLILQRDPTRSDVTIEVQAAGEVSGPWTTVATSTLGAPFTGLGYVAGDDPGPGIKTVEIRDVVNIADAPRRFLRAKITR
jgi:uncharacterized delta-60 repeat protein